MPRNLQRNSNYSGYTSTYRGLVELMDVDGDLEHPLEGVHDLRDDHAVSVKHELGLGVVVGVVVAEANLGQGRLGGCVEHK